MGSFRAGDCFAAFDLPEIPDCMMSMLVVFCCRLDSGGLFMERGSGEAVSSLTYVYSGIDGHRLLYKWQKIKLHTHC